jgi:hypothetical protein
VPTSTSPDAAGSAPSMLQYGRIPLASRKSVASTETGCWLYSRLSWRYGACPTTSAPSPVNAASMAAMSSSRRVSVPAGETTRLAP